MSGFVVIHRDLLGHADFRNDAEAMAFAWMVMRAAWKPVRVRYKGKPVELDRGQLCVSQRDMASALDRDKTWVERLWKRLQAQGMIQCSREAAAMLITVCNYNKYQAKHVTVEAVDEAVDEAEVRQTRGAEQRKEQLNKEQQLPLRASGDALEGDDEGNQEDDGLKLLPKHVVEKWNEIAPSLGKPCVRDLTPERRQNLKARIAQYKIEDFIQVFDNISTSPFLRGDTGKNFCNFDWAMKKANFQKILEGNYNNG